MCKGVAFTFKSAICQILTDTFFSMGTAGDKVVVKKVKKKWSNQQTSSHYISVFCVLSHFLFP